MKKIENNTVLTGIVGSDAQIRQFTTASVARFPLAVSRLEKNGEETNRVSAFVNVEAWRKNENTKDFDIIKKGALITVHAYLKPETWTDKDGVSHSRIILVATKLYLAPDKADSPKEDAPSKA